MPKILLHADARNPPLKAQPAIAPPSPHHPATAARCPAPGDRMGAETRERPLLHSFGSLPAILGGLRTFPTLYPPGYPQHGGPHSGDVPAGTHTPRTPGLRGFRIKTSSPDLDEPGEDRVRGLGSEFGTREPKWVFCRWTGGSLCLLQL